MREADRESNPRLIHCSITGFGSDGPYVDRAAYDTVGIALSGILHLYLDPTKPQIYGPTLSDNATGCMPLAGSSPRSMRVKRPAKASESRSICSRAQSHLSRTRLPTGHKWARLWSIVTCGLFAVLCVGVRRWPGDIHPSFGAR